MSHRELLFLRFAVEGTIRDKKISRKIRNLQLYIHVSE